MYDYITISLFSLNIIFWSITIVLVYLKYFEIAIFTVAISPWPSAFVSGLGFEASGDFGGSFIGFIRVGFLALAGSAGLIKCLRMLQVEKIKLPIEFKIMGLLLISGICTIVYSIDPKVTFVKSFTALAIFFFALGLFCWIREKKNFDGVINIIFCYIVLVSIFSIISPLFLENHALSRPTGRFMGAWGHPNQMGAFCMLSYPFVLLKIEQCKNKKKIVLYFLFLSLMVMHFYTGSRSSIVAAITSILLSYFIQKNVKKVMFFLFVLVFFTVFAFYWPSVQKNFTREIDGGQSIVTLTKRDELWKASIDILKERPFHGYGYGVTGQIFKDSKYYRPNYPYWDGRSKVSLHNGYLSIAVGEGVIVLLLYMYLFLSPVLKSLTYEKSPELICLIRITIMTLILNFVETSLVYSGVVGIFFWFSWTLLLRVSLLTNDKLKLN